MLLLLLAILLLLAVLVCGLLCANHNNEEKFPSLCELVMHFSVVLTIYVRQCVNAFCFQLLGYSKQCTYIIKNDRKWLARISPVDKKYKAWSCYVFCFWCLTNSCGTVGRSFFKLNCAVRPIQNAGTTMRIQFLHDDPQSKKYKLFQIYYWHRKSNHVITLSLH